METKEMKKVNYKRLYVTREESHSHFGGYIYFSDFNTGSRHNNVYRGSEVASRIASDLRFDESCKKNIQ